MPWRKGQKLRVVSEREATGPVARIYQEIRESLGLPFVPAPFLVFAAVPKLLELEWEALRPFAQSSEFFALAERLRADGYTRVHSYFQIPDLCRQVEDLRFSTGARQELTSTIELLHYADALVLLLMTAQLQAFDRKLGKAASNIGAGTSSGRARFNERPLFIEEATAPGPTRKLYDEIKRTTAMPSVSSDYLAMARWPDFLAAYWQMMKPIVESPLYSMCTSGIRQDACEMARELPVPLSLTCDQLTDAGMADEDVGACVRITEMFVKNLSETLVNVAAAKIGLEGGTTAAHQLTPEELPIAA